MYGTDSVRLRGLRTEFLRHTAVDIKYLLLFQMVYLLMFRWGVAVMIDDVLAMASIVIYGVCVYVCLW